MNETQVGALFRAVRIRRGLTQSDVAAAAGLSQSLVSSLECGDFAGSSFGVIRRVAAALSVSLGFEVRWRGMEAAKLLDERHSALVRLAVERIRGAGWEAWPERTFSIWGERGSIDILAWRASERAMLAVEVKTRMPDLQDLLSTMDRKRRLLPAIAKDSGLAPLAIGSVLLLPEETWARNRVRQFQGIFDAAMPARTVETRQWLEKPAADLRGIWFLLDTSRDGPKRRGGGQMRVSAGRRQSPGVGRPDDGSLPG